MKKVISNKFEISKCCSDFSLILLIFLFVSFPKQMKEFSHSILGRLVAVLLIIFYSFVDIFYGLFFCIIVIYYYQLDFDENMLNIHEGFFWEWNESSGKSQTPNTEIHNTTVYSSYDPENIYESEGSNFKIDSVSNTKPLDSISAINGEKEKAFRDANCTSGMLKYNGMDINVEMAEHIFNELKFDGEPCDPCNRLCKFSVVDKKILTEEEIVKPKSSNDWMDFVNKNLA